jgi:hypothetical protein
MKSIEWIGNKLQELSKNDVRDVYLMDKDIPAEMKLKIPVLLDRLQGQHVVVEYAAGFGTNSSDFKPLEAKFIPGIGKVVVDPYAALAEQVPDSFEKGQEVIYFLKLNPSELGNISSADPGDDWEKRMDEKFKSEGPFLHIADPKLKDLYKKINRSDYDVVVMGEKMLKKTKDKLAVLEAIQQSVQNIIDDFKEHGNDNKALYDDHPKSYFDKKLTEISEQINKVRSGGESSDVFTKYKASYKQWLGKL